MKYQGFSIRPVGLKLALVAGALMVGCGFQPDLINSDLTVQLGVKPLALPVNAQQSVLISAKNNTGRLLQASIVFGIFQNNGKIAQLQVPIILQPTQTLGMWVACVSAQLVSVGDIDQQINNPTAATPVPSGFVFSTANVTTNATEIPPLNQVLVQGTNFGCGDNITFVYSPAQVGFACAVNVQRLAN